MSWFKRKPAEPVVERPPWTYPSDEELAGEKIPLARHIMRSGALWIVALQAFLIEDHGMTPADASALVARVMPSHSAEPIGLESMRGIVRDLLTTAPESSRV